MNFTLKFLSNFLWNFLDFSVVSDIYIGYFFLMNFWIVSKFGRSLGFGWLNLSRLAYLNTSTCVLKQALSPFLFILLNQISFLCQLPPFIRLFTLFSHHILSCFIFTPYIPLLHTIGVYCKLKGVSIDLDLSILCRILEVPNEGGTNPNINTWPILPHFDP